MLSAYELKFFSTYCALLCSRNGYKVHGPTTEPAFVIYIDIFIKFEQA